MRLPIPFGRKGLIAAAAIAAGVVYWRVRARRLDAADRQWEEDVQGAIQEGVAAGHASTANAEPAESTSA